MTCTHCESSDKINIPWMTIYFGVIMGIFMVSLYLLNVENTHPKIFLFALAISIGGVFIGKVIDLI